MSTPAASPAPSRLDALMGSPFVTFFVQQTALLLQDRRASWKRVTYLGLLGIVMIAAGHAYPTFGRAGQETGRNVFYGLVGLNAYAALGLMGVFCTAVSTLRESGVLELLRITALSPFALLGALCASLLARTVLLLTAQLPFFLFCIPLGGITYHTVFGAYLFTIAVLLFLCPFGIFWSVVCKTGHHAALAAFVSLFVGYLGLRLFASFPWGLLLPALPNAHSWLIAQIPFHVFADLLQGGPWPVTSVFLHCILGGLFLWTAARKFDETCDCPEPTPVSASTPASDFGPDRGPDFGPDRDYSLDREPSLPPAPVVRSIPRAQAHPLAWKEFHFSARGKLSRDLRWTLYPIFGFLFGSLSNQFGFAFLFVGAFGLLFDLPRAMSRMLGVEVRDHTLGDLAILPLTPWQIVAEKIRGVVPLLIPTLLCTLGGALLLLAGALTNDHFIVHHELKAADLLILAYVAIQFAFLLVLVIYFSLTQPANSYSTSLVFVLIYNWLGLGFLSTLHWLPFAGRLFIPAAFAVWLMRVLIRAFPTTFNRVAGQ
jgi:hypothetical protein